VFLVYVFLSPCFWLPVPVQSISLKDLFLKLFIMCRVGRKTLHTHYRSLV